MPGKKRKQRNPGLLLLPACLIALAVLLFGEEEIRVEIPLCLLPSGVQEGDWLEGYLGAGPGAHSRAQGKNPQSAGETKESGQAVTEV